MTTERTDTVMLAPDQPAVKQWLLISEFFGPTVQGEGARLGKPSVFLRLGGCNEHCVWCDTAYTWDWTGANGIKYDPRKELRRASFEELGSWLININNTTKVRMLTITGGEPLLQDEAIYEYLKHMRNSYYEWRDANWFVEVETNGTRIPFHSSEYVDCFNVSPKLANSGNSMSLRRNAEALFYFARLAHSDLAVFKFVVTGPSDFEEVNDICNAYGIPSHKVYVMPEGRSEVVLETRMQTIITEAIAAGYNITPRLHVQLWGDKRGR